LRKTTIGCPVFSLARAGRQLISGRHSMRSKVAAIPIPFSPDSSTRTTEAWHSVHPPDPNPSPGGSMMTNSSFDPAFIFDSEYKKIPDELRSRVKPSCSLPSWRTLTGTRTSTRSRDRFSIVVDVGVVFSVICCGSVLQFVGKRGQPSQFVRDPAPPDLREEPAKHAKARNLKSEL